LLPLLLPLLLLVLGFMDDSADCFARDGDESVVP
jgi:hypothetical protein